MAHSLLSLARVALALLLLTGAAAHAQVFPAVHWQKAESPEAVGWSGDKLRAAETFSRTLHTDAWMLVHRGVVVFESGATARPSNVASVRKSVLSILVGIHAERGTLVLDKTLAQLNINDKGGLTDEEKQATVRQLLQARSGVYHGAAYETAAMKAARPARGSHKPGEFFYYNNWDFNALGSIFQQATGSTVFESLRDDLATPLQLQDFNFNSDGFFYTETSSIHPAYAMRLSTRDMARIGLLMARNGQWNGRQLVPKEWVEESTRRHSITGAASGYGYMWWVGLSDRFAARNLFPGKVFIAAGNRGQFIVVDPVRDIVIAHKVDFEKDANRDVTSAQLVDLMAKIFEARLPEQ